MIRNQAEYREVLRRIKEVEEYLELQRKGLLEQGYPDADVEYAMGPLLSFHAQLLEEKEWYERVTRGEIEPIQNLTQIGRLLIAARITLGVSQKELADRLGTTEAQVSRDERNEYHNVTTEKAQRVFESLGVRIETRLDLRENPDPRRNRELVPA